MERNTKKNVYLNIHIYMYLNIHIYVSEYTFIYIYMNIHIYVCMYTWASLVAQLGKESACSVGDFGLIPGLGRSPEEGNGYPLQYSDLENSMDHTHTVLVYLSIYVFTALYVYICVSNYLYI